MLLLSESLLRCDILSEQSFAEWTWMLQNRPIIFIWSVLGPILGLRPANERCCYFVTASLIGRVQA